LKRGYDFIKVYITRLLLSLRILAFFDLPR